MQHITRYFLCAIFLSGTMLSHAQVREFDSAGKKRETHHNATLLEAKFTADRTSGSAPLEVHFTDQSTGSPVTWLWYFGDGDSATQQHPVHTYQANGTYTVKLTISDGTYFYSLEKQNFITVTNSYAGCDTLHWPLPEPLLYYYYKSPNSGYLTGNNSYGDKAVADFFDNTFSHAAITSVDIDFAKGVKGASNEAIVVGFWDLNITFGRPGNLIRTDTISLVTIVSDVAANRITHIEPVDPISISGPFFAGVFFPIITGDTIAVLTTQAGALSMNTGWILDKLDQWSTLVHISGYNFTTAIYPKVCILEGIAEDFNPLPVRVWPNPAEADLFVKITEEQAGLLNYELMNASGIPYDAGKINSDSVAKLDVSRVPSGVYLLKLWNDKKVSWSKVIVNH